MGFNGFGAVGLLGCRGFGAGGLGVERLEAVRIEGLGFGVRLSWLAEGV